jgi:hypothetical protein
MRVYDGSAWIDSGSGLTFAEISATPTTLAGYGITDAVASSSALLLHKALLQTQHWQLPQCLLLV